MMRRSAGDDRRLTELLAERALFGLGDSEQRELSSLLEQHPHEDAEAFDRVAADFYLASQSGPYEPLPAHVAQRIRESWPLQSH